VSDGRDEGLSDQGAADVAARDADVVDAAPRDEGARDEGPVGDASCTQDQVGCEDYCQMLNAFCASIPELQGVIPDIGACMASCPSLSHDAFCCRAPHAVLAQATPDPNCWYAAGVADRRGVRVCD